MSWNSLSKQSQFKDNYRILTDECYEEGCLGQVYSCRKIDNTDPIIYCVKFIPINQEKHNTAQKSEIEDIIKLTISELDKISPYQINLVNIFKEQNQNLNCIALSKAQKCLSYSLELEDQKGVDLSIYISNSKFCVQKQITIINLLNLLFNSQSRLQKIKKSYAFRVMDKILQYMMGLSQKTREKYQMNLIMVLRNQRINKSEKYKSWLMGFQNLDYVKDSRINHVINQNMRVIKLFSLIIGSTSAFILNRIQVSKCNISKFIGGLYIISIKTEQYMNCMILSCMNSKQHSINKYCYINFLRLYYQKKFGQLIEAACDEAVVIFACPKVAPVGGLHNPISIKLGFAAHKQQDIINEQLKITQACYQIANLETRRTCFQISNALYQEKISLRKIWASKLGQRLMTETY